MYKPMITACLAACLALPVQAQTMLSWASKDVQYAENLLPPLRTDKDTLATVWRGERAGLQAVVYAPQATGSLQVRLTELTRSKGEKAFAQATAHFVDYVTTDNFQACGYHPTHLTPYRVPDVITMEGEARQLATFCPSCVVYARCGCGCSSWHSPLPSRTA